MRRVKNDELTRKNENEDDLKVFSVGRVKRVLYFGLGKNGICDYK